LLLKKKITKTINTGLSIAMIGIPNANILSIIYSLFVCVTKSTL